MKEAVVMSLGGMMIALEVDAKEAINAYLEKSRAKLKGDEAVDEIIEDLELAIASHLNEKGFSAKRAANKTAVQEVLKSMGEVDSAEESEEKEQKPRTDWHGIFQEPFHLSKTNHVIFGLCGGIAERIGIDAFWVRIVVLFLAFASGGWFVGAYFIAGIVVSILDSGQKVDAKSVTAQVRQTSRQLGQTKGLHQIDATVRQVLRTIYLSFNAVVLVGFVALLSWALVAMSVRPLLDVPFIGTLRSSLAYIFITSGLLLGILASIRPKTFNLLNPSRLFTGRQW